MIINSKNLRIWMKAIVAIFPGDTKENHGKSQSR